MADNVPAFDDIPSFDDLPDAPAQQSGGVPRFDDIPSFDALPDDNARHHEAEGPLATGVREAVHAAAPAAGGLVAAGYGALIGAVGGPVGAFAGGVAGMVAGSMATNYVQEKGLHAFGVDDSEQRSINEHENPNSAFFGGIAPAVATMSPMVAGKLAQQVLQRGAGAAIMTGFEAGQEYLNEGHVDPKKTAIAAAAGAVFPSVNRVGAKLMGVAERTVPGRPGRTANPSADQAHVDVDDANAEVEVGASALAQGPHVSDGVTTGNPQSAPTRSERKYPKQRPLGMPEENFVQPTQGEMDPAVAVALAEANPAPASQVPVPDAAAGQPGAAPGQAARPPVQPSPEAAAPPPVRGNEAGPVVDTGMPQAGEPVAVGENEATPLPPEMPERAAKAIARSKTGIPFMVTKAMKQRLGVSGFSPEEIKTLTPEQANEFLSTNGSVAEVRSFREKYFGDDTVASLQPAAAAQPEGEYTPEQQANRLAAIEARKTMPALKGETPINDSVTPAQKAAGNYPKARTHDFGKPIRVETHEGDIRRSQPDAPVQWENKSPADYGYFGKTKGNDKDQIDFYRPKEGSPDQGDKHFVIDQKNVDTGKFDEHKVMTYYKDEATAKAAYERAFSDDKGADRIHAITEVDRGGLVKWLAKHTSKAATQPFSGPLPKEPVKKPAAERAVAKDLIGKLEASGKTDEAARIKALPDAQLDAALAGKRTRKYGTNTGASAGYPVEGVLTAEGKAITANTKAKAAERSAAHKQMEDWFEASKPPSQLKDGAESNGEMLDRLKSNPYAGRAGGWEPTHKPASWLLAREARQVTQKPTPGNIKKFRDAERLLRGKPEDVENYRGGNRIEADIARSKRSGDDAVANAEAQAATHNTVEDDLIASIDAKRSFTMTAKNLAEALKLKNKYEAQGYTYKLEPAANPSDPLRLSFEKKPKFDVPHEEAEAMVKPKPVKTSADLKALPRKTIDAGDSALAKIDTKAISKTELRKAEAATLAGKKSTAANVPSENKSAGEGRQIKVVDETEKARIMEALNAATKKAASHDPKLEITAPVPRSQRFLDDTSGAVGGAANAQRGQRTMAAIRAALQKTDHASYVSKKSQGPVDDYLRSLGEDLHQMVQENRNHEIAAMNRGGEMPKEFNNKKVMEQVYNARDADSAHVDLPGKQAGKTNVESLPPEILKGYNENLKSLLDENDQFFKNIGAIDPDRMGPSVMHHMQRITKGGNGKYNLLQGHDDPTSPHYNAIAVSAGAAKDRAFYALENAAGQRFLVQPHDNGYTLWDKYKATRIKDPTFDFEEGGKYTVTPKKAGGKPVDYTMRQAMTKEIEDNAQGPIGRRGRIEPMKYYKNAGMSAVVTNIQLGTMARNLARLEQLKSDPAFKKLVTTNRAKADARGWQESKLPNFKGIHMDPRMREVFDDFAGHLETPYSQINSAITKMLFWMPTAHLANVGAHWFVGRGWDNFTPQGMRSLFVDTPRALKSVIMQDEFQQQMRREGAGTIYGSVLTRNKMQKIGKAFHEDIVRNPSDWNPIAGKLGVSVEDLGKSVYDASSKVMWAGNDMFLTQRVMELMRKGMTMRQAIIDSERDIPNYRLPTRIIGSGEKGRQFQQLVSDPRVLSFGRYHYGMMNSYANIIKDAIGKDATGGDRLEAVGKLVAMGMLGIVVFPLLDTLQKKITGNEGASQQRRGPISIPSHLVGAARGKEDIASAARSTLTIPPLYQTVLETLSNKDFRGKPIVEPGDVAAGFKGSAPAAGRAVLQETSHLARGLVSPLNTLSNATQKGVGPVGAIRDQALDAKNPSEKANKYDRLSGMHNQRDSFSRFKHGGSDPLEAAYNKLFGYH